MADSKPQVAKREQALAEFRLAMKWIVAGAVVLVIAALVFVSLTADLTIHVIVATILGVFFAFLLGAGLFALAFFSDKSGHDQTVTDATSKPPRPSE